VDAADQSARALAGGAGVAGETGQLRRIEGVAALRDAVSRWRDWQATALVRRSLAGVWRDHKLITFAVAIAVLVRVLAMLAFRPALFTPDSFAYLAQSVNPRPGLWHPSGYPMLLFLLAPFHSLPLVVSVQHLMGIAVAVAGYVVLRQRNVPAWGAVLAMSPVLFDSRQIALESFILPDVWYGFLIMLAVVLLLVRGKPAAGRCALAGLALAGASITRGNGAPEMAAVLIILLIQRVGWRAIAAAAVAFAVPVLAYMGWFAIRHGDFAITNSDGIFLWSRTMSFANCAVIKPPADLRPLCPERQPHHPAGPAPAWSLSAQLAARQPTNYLWAEGAWWRHDAQPGFTAANNALAEHFALAAIRAQPAAYVRTVTGDVILAFLTNDRSLSFRTLHFTQVPEIPVLSPGQIRHLRRYGHTTSNTHPVQPYAYFLSLYQEPVYFPGLVFGLVVVAGLAGIIRNWRRRGGPAALPWLVAVVGIVTPVAVHQYHYRYWVPVVPVACLAAALAFARGPVEADAMAPTPPSSLDGGSGPSPAPARPRVDAVTAGVAATEPKMILTAPATPQGRLLAGRPRG
jgi:hypothetical protein